MTKTFFIILIIFFLSCSRDNESSKNIQIGDSLIFYTYGFDMNTYLKNPMRDDIAEKYGFYFKAVPDSLVTDSLKLFAEINNQMIDSVLKIKLGVNWHSKFYSEVDEMYRIHIICLNLIDTPSIFHPVRRAMIRVGKGTCQYYFKTVTTNTPGVYSVVGCVRPHFENKTKYISRVTIDFNKKTVLSVDTVN